MLIGFIMKNGLLLKVLLLLFPLAMLAPTARAYDFAATSATGQVLYYDILTDSTVSVTFPNQVGGSYYAGFTSPSGNLLIPSTVSHLNTTYQVVSIGSHAFHGCASLTTVIIPNSVTAILDYSFFSCSSLFSVHFPSSISAISDYAFSNCVQLQSITLPDAVSVLGVGVFQGCVLLNSVTFNTQLTTIGNLAFEGCSSLSSIAIPNSVTLMGNWVFGNCTSLDSVTIGQNVAMIQPNVFSGCNNVRILQYDCQHCTFSSNLSASILPVARLEQLVVGDSVGSIPAYAFMGASHLKEVYLGVSLDSILPYAFSACDSILQLKIRRMVPPCLSSSAFSSYQAELVVPCGSQSAYQTASNWANFDSVSNFFPYLASTTSNNNLWGTTAVTQQPTCSNPYVQVQAFANSGFHFLKWMDENTDNPRTDLLVSDKQYLAQFVSDFSSILVYSSDTAFGSVSGSGIYQYQTPVTILAVPRYGYHFVAWNDGEILNPRTFSVSQDSTFSAHFAPNRYSINISANDNQMGVTSGAGYYEYATWAEISAQPTNGYHFVQWNDGVTENPRSLQVTSDSVISAIFAPNRYSVVVTSNDTLLGSVTGGGSFDYHSTVQLHAIAAPHCTFSHWSDGIMDNPRTLLVESDTLCFAIFVPTFYQVSAVSNDSAIGHVIGSGHYRYGENALLQAVPDENSYFVSWSDNETANPRVLVVSADTMFYAIFARNAQYEINVVSNNPNFGTVSGSGIYYYSDTVQISAVPQGNHIEFYSWDDGCTDNPRTIHVVNDATYTALFGPELVPFSISSNDETLGLVYGDGLYPYGTRVTATAVPAPDSRFINWSDGSIDNPRYFVLTDPISLQANFVFSADYLDIASPTQVPYVISVMHLQVRIDVSTESSIAVYDLQGRQVVNDKTSHLVVDIPHPGVYLIRVGGNLPQKIVIY